MSQLTKPGSITYHHHEYRNPGGSPNVMFFSHRIYSVKKTTSDALITLSVPFQTASTYTSN